MDQDLYVPLYEDNNHYYYVNPFSEKAVWLKDVETDLFPHLQNPEEQITFVLVENEPTEVVVPLEKKLENKYITVNTSSQKTSVQGGSVNVGVGEFIISLFPTVPTGSHIVNFRLHTAVVSKTQHTIDTHNNRLDIEVSGGGLYELTIPTGNYSACQIGKKIQDLVRASVPGLADFKIELDPITATMQFSSASSGFGIRVPIDARVRPVCQSPIGLRGTDTNSAYYEESGDDFCYFRSKPSSGLGHELRSGHVDVSGTRMLRYSLRQYGGGGLEVGHVPLHDEPSTGVVCYSNRHAGTLEWGWKTPLEFSPVVVCVATDSLGRPYNFHGVACTYVFEVTIL